MTILVKHGHIDVEPLENVIMKTTQVVVEMVTCKQVKPAGNMLCLRETWT